MAPSLVFIDVFPHDDAARHNLARGIDVLRSERGTLDARWDDDHRRLVLGALGFDDLEWIVGRLSREFRLDARLGRPVIAYKETLTRSAEGHGRFIRQTGGRGQFGEVRLRIHPSTAGSGYVLDRSGWRGGVPERFVAPIERALQEALAAGVDGGHPIVDVRVELIDGSYHETDSSDAAFHTAATMALADAAARTPRVVLEPVMTVELTVPCEYSQAGLALIESRRGIVESTATEGNAARLVARVSLAELPGWESDLIQSTFGLATCTVAFAGYRPVARPPGGGDDDTAPVGAPRRPASPRRWLSAEVPEPDDPHSV